jgi:hypothetical protein
MSTDPERPSPFAHPRPGVVKALGILNVVFAVLILMSLVMELMWVYAVLRTAPGLSEPGAPPSANPAGIAMMGMNDPKLIRFTLLDAITGLVVNLMMLASGIGLINTRRWGAQLWAWTAWIKIVRLVLLWGFLYIVVVAPSFSESMARGALAMVNSRVGVRGAPSLGQLTRAYAIMNLIVAAGMVVFGVVYPVLSLWMLSRPGVKAALKYDAQKEPELP